MSNLERRRRAERARPQNTELADVLKKIREESGMPIFSRAADTPPSLSLKKEKKIRKSLPSEAGRAKPRRVTLENGKARVEVFDEEIGAFVQDPSTVSSDAPQPPPVPLLKVDPEIVAGTKKETWQRQAQLARARGAEAMPPPIPQRSPSLSEREAAAESDRTGFEQTAVDLQTTFRKRFMPSEAELKSNETARRFAAKWEPEPVRLPQSDMITRLDAWIRGEQERVPRRGLEKRLMKDFPAMKAEITGFADASARALEQLGEEIVHDAERRGLGRQRRFASGWMRERYDAMNKARIAKFMIPLTMGIGRIANSPKLRYALPAAAFIGALAGASSSLYEHADALSQFHADADALPSFAPDSFGDASVPHPAEAEPVVVSGGSPKLTMLNGDTPDAVVDGPVIEAGEGKPNEPLEDAGSVAEPIEVRGDVSVWSSLLDGLGEKGIDLTQHGEQAFAQAVQRAIEDTHTQSVFIEYKGEGLSGAAWDKIPDGATIHFDLLFGNEGFLDRLKELLESSEYKSLGKELRPFGGVDGFISDVQDAFGVRYL